MNKRVKIWGRQFSLGVYFDTYESDEITDIQTKALESFLSKSEEIFQSSKRIEQYCMKHNKKEIGNTITNIFKYVIPTTIFVKQDSKRVVLLLCNYKFDEEHGIALQFENESLKSIGPQDNYL